MTTHDTDDFEFFASCLAGLEDQLALELKGLGVKRTRPLGGGVAFYGPAKLALKVCLWSRLASRVLAVEGRFDAKDADELYEGVRTLYWEDILPLKKTFAVRARGMNANLRNTHFTEMRVKDAVCDRLDNLRGVRPSVDTTHPDLVIDVRVHDERATVSVDLSGRPLNKRAYFGKRAGSEMPLLCSYAAALLSFAGWGDLVARGYRFVDALRADGGTGAAAGASPRKAASAKREMTILEREARAIALDEAPGAARSEWGFMSWGRFDEGEWNALLDEADDRAERAQAARRDAAPDAPELLAAVIVDPENEDATSTALDSAFVRAAVKAPANSVFALVGGEGAAERFGDDPEVFEKIGHGRIRIKARVFTSAPEAPETVTVPDAFGVLDVDDVHHVLERERLEVELVGGVVVGGDGFGVAVDHDRLVPRIGERVGRVHAAVIELDALTDAVGACAQDHRALLRLRRDLAFAGVVGLIVVSRLARELGGAGVDRLERGHHTEALAVGTDLELG